MRVLVTGANGFVGSAVVQSGADNGWSMRSAIRGTVLDSPSSVKAVTGLEVAPGTDWRAALDGIDAVVHCAARVHLMNDAAADPLEAFRRTNVEGTLTLARQAAAAGVCRFVFISSIKVNGESTVNGVPFRAADPPAPRDPYGVSKAEAERELLRLAAASGMEVVVLRPPLVYGPGVKANFLRILKTLHSGFPLPFGMIDNRRSLVALDNLVDLILTCVRHPAAAGQTFLVSDGEDLSTTDLLRRTALALGRPARLLPVPVAALQFAVNAVGQRELGQRLFDTLQVDIAKTRALLGWAPKIGVDEGLRQTAVRFLADLRA